MKKLMLFSAILLCSWTVKKPPKTIVLQPYTGFPKECIEYVKDRLTVMYPYVSVAKPIDLPMASVFYGRHRADTLISFLSKSASPGSIMVGLTNKDITSFKGNNDNWGIFGLGYYYGNACCVSTYRLSKNDKGNELLKTVLHEIGHNEGLDHCATPGCFMEDADGKNKFKTETDFCDKCKKYLKRKGWNL